MQSLSEQGCERFADVACTGECQRHVVCCQKNTCTVAPPALAQAWTRCQRSLVGSGTTGPLQRWFCLLGARGLTCPPLRVHQKFS